jgi:lipid-A-disaccharide synthase
MIIAGEASGDLHGSGVVRELKRRKPACEIYGIGGDKMQSAGMELIYHTRELSVMGFVEVLQHLPLLRSIEKTMTTLLRLRKPDVVLLIDYPGLNLRLARAAHQEGIRVLYYISPQVWAWNPGRLRKMKSMIDEMLVVFPFEEEIYRNQGIQTQFVGHPLLEVLGEPQGKEGFCKRHGLDPKRFTVGLFPGSRMQEVERIFPVMLGAMRVLLRTHDAQVAVGISSSLSPDLLRSFERSDVPVTFIQHATHDLMKNADCAVVTSGTATLETGYYQTPMVVVYRMSWLSYLISRMLIRIRMIGLVNIVAEEKIVPELVQGKCTPDRIAAEVAKYLDDAALRADVSERLGVIRQRLGTAGASAKVAQAVLAHSG